MTNSMVTWMTLGVLLLAAVPSVWGGILLDTLPKRGVQKELVRGVCTLYCALTVTIIVIGFAFLLQANNTHGQALQLIGALSIGSALILILSGWFLQKYLRTLTPPR